MSSPGPASRKRRRRVPAPAPRRRAGPEILVGIAAILLSCGALVVSVFQARILREQQGATVWPRVALGGNHIEDGFTLTVANMGVGPAIVREVEYAVHGRGYHSAWAFAKGEIGGDTLSQTPKYFQTITAGSVLRPGDSADVLSLPGNAALADRMDALTSDSSYHARVLYSDVYGTCWQVDNADVRAAGRCAEAEQ